MNTYQEQVALNNMLSEANGEITSLKAQLAAAHKQNDEARAETETLRKQLLEATSKREYLDQSVQKLSVERDEAHAEATKLRDAGKVLVEALEESKQALMEIVVHGWCDCDIPNTKTCVVCQCTLAHRRTVEALARAREAGFNP